MLRPPCIHSCFLCSAVNKTSFSDLDINTFCFYFHSAQQPNFFWNRAGKLIIFALRATCVQTLHYFLQARNSISLWTVHPFMVNSILIFWCSGFTSWWRRHFCTLGLILTKDSFDSEASNRCWICCSGIFGDSRPLFSGFTCISYFGVFWAAFNINSDIILPHVLYML